MGKAEILGNSLIQNLVKGGILMTPQYEDEIEYQASSTFNGTSDVPILYELEEDKRIINITDVIVLSGGIFIDSAPKQNLRPSRPGVQPEVLESLEWSIKEYEDVWSELAKR